MHDRAREVASFVQYEWDMFNWAFATAQFQFMPGTGGNVWCIETNEGLKDISDDPGANYALLEVLLIHARVIWDFLSRSRNDSGIHEDDVLAEDFFDTPDEWKKPVGGYLANHKKRLNKALAHLSYGRLDFEATDKRWDASAIAEELTAAWDQFWAALPEDRKEWFLETRSIPE